MSIKIHKDIKMVDIDKIQPNSFNSNEVSEEEQNKINDDIVKNGFIGAILVRPISKDKFEIVDGEHRWRAMKTLGESQIPVVVMPQDDSTSMINSVRLNTERGTQNPLKLGKILKSLQETGMSMAQLEDELVYDNSELQDRLSLLELPDDLEDIIKEHEDKEKKEMSIIWSFLVPNEYTPFIEKAVGKFGEQKGLAFGELCKQIVEGQS